MEKILYIALVAAAAFLMTSAKAQAWGAAHVGYTHVGPSGVQHYGRTVAAGPNGAYSGGHYGSYGASGSYHAAYGHSETYGHSSYGAYHYGASSYDSYGRYGGTYRGF
jgi:hypothetical protein